MAILETSLKFISDFGIFLFLISLCEQVLKTHQKHNIFCCVLQQKHIGKPPDFLNEGATGIGILNTDLDSKLKLEF